MRQYNTRCSVCVCVLCVYATILYYYYYYYSPQQKSEEGKRRREGKIYIYIMDVVETTTSHSAQCEEDAAAAAAATTTTTIYATTTTTTRHIDVYRRDLQVIVSLYGSAYLDVVLELAMAMEDKDEEVDDAFFVVSLVLPYHFSDDHATFTHDAIVHLSNPDVANYSLGRDIDYIGLRRHADLWEECIERYLGIVCPFPYSHIATRDYELLLRRTSIPLFASQRLRRYYMREVASTSTCINHTIITTACSFEGLVPIATLRDVDHRGGVIVSDSLDGYRVTEFDAQVSGIVRGHTTPSRTLASAAIIESRLRRLRGMASNFLGDGDGKRSGVVIGGGAVVGALTGVDDPAMDVDFYIVADPSLSRCNRRDTAKDLWTSMLYLPTTGLGRGSDEYHGTDTVRVLTRIGDIVSNLHDYYKDNKDNNDNNDSNIAATATTTTTSKRHSCRRLQVVHRIYASARQVLEGFDIDLCQVLFDGKTVWGTPAACRALSSGWMLYDPYTMSNSGDYRYAKYMSRYGMGVMCVGIPQAIIDAIFNPNCMPHRREEKVDSHGRDEGDERGDDGDGDDACPWTVEAQQWVSELIYWFFSPERTQGICALHPEDFLAACLSPVVSLKGFARLFTMIAYSSVGLLGENKCMDYDDDVVSIISSVHDHLMFSDQRKAIASDWAFASDSVLQDDIGVSYFCGSFFPDVVDIYSDLHAACGASIA